MHDSGKIDLSKFEWCETDIYDLKIYSGMQIVDKEMQ